MVALDSMTLSELNLKNPHRFILMGTPDQERFVEPAKASLPVVLDDFSENYSMHSDQWQRDAQNHLSFQQISSRTEIHLIHPPRENKKLLVLDLDHTLLDFKDSQLCIDNMSVLKRPYMDYFLSQTFRHYDLAIWSQTSWRWLELKLTELGMLTNPSYRISFVLDKTSMFDYKRDPDQVERKRRKKKHHVKPLQLIWDRFSPRWQAINTLHVDDLSRNFLMNKPNGVPVSAYYRHYDGAAQDTELLDLARYLTTNCAILEDVTSKDHSNWKTNGNN